jgi:hypothetical protein
LKRGRAELYFLYKNLPLSDDKKISLQFDPSALPFLSQRLLIVLSGLQPENYSFYQRKLAEFQSRLESTLEVGRSQIRDMHMLDLTGAASPWINAAVLESVRPPDDLMKAWADGGRLRELELAIGEAGRRGWWVVTDAWSPRHILVRLAGVRNNIYIEVPEDEYDFFAYMHDIYLQIWNASMRN